MHPISTYILAHVEKHPQNIAAMVCKKFSVSRMTATRHLQELITEKKIIKSGKTYDTRYYLVAGKNKSIDLPINETLEEFSVLKIYFEKEFTTLPKNQQEICDYCCTELINNVKDHSKGAHFHMETRWEKQGLHIEISDDGVGIFKKLKMALGLVDFQDGLLALTKGKITTDPKNHTGEGVFFSSRAVDQFVMEANGINYTKNNMENDWFYQESTVKTGTKITLFIHYDCERLLKNVFAAYMNPENYDFDKTEILVELSKLGDEKYISRSQAKRILANLNRFSHIVLDFRDIETVGQGFVDEVFRVFRNQFPHIQIEYRNANENIVFMIKRGLPRNS